MRFIRNALIFATAAYTLSGCGGEKKDNEEHGTDENEDETSNEVEDVARAEPDDVEECDATTLELEDRIKANAAKLEEQSGTLKQLREQHSDCGVDRLILSEKENRQAELDKIKKLEVDKIRLDRVRYKSPEKIMNKLEKEINDMDPSESRSAKEVELAGLRKTFEGMVALPGLWDERDSLNKKEHQMYLIKNQIIQEMIESAEQEIVRLNRLLQVQPADPQTKSREAQLVTKRSEVERLRSMQKDFESKEDMLKDLENMLITDDGAKQEFDRLQGRINRIDLMIDWMSKQESRKKDVAALDKKRDELVDKLTLAQVALRFNEYNQTVKEYHEYRMELMAKSMNEVEGELEELKREFENALTDDTTAQFEHELKIAKSVLDGKRSAMRKFKSSLTKMANQILSLDVLMNEVDGVAVALEGSEDTNTILVGNFKKLEEIKGAIKNEIQLIKKLTKKGFRKEYDAEFDQLVSRYPDSGSERLDQCLADKDRLFSDEPGPWSDVEDLISNMLKANKSRMTISKIIKDIPSLSEAEVLKFVRELEYDDLVGMLGLLGQTEILIGEFQRRKSQTQVANHKKLFTIVSREAGRQGTRVAKIQELTESVRKNVRGSKDIRAFRDSIGSLDPRKDIDETLTDIERRLQEHIVAAGKKARK